MTENMKNKEETDKDLRLYHQYIKFLEKRRGDGREYTVQIMNVLFDERNKDPGKIGWVRARDMKRRVICPETTLFRLLDGLYGDKIIEKDERNMRPNFSRYRLPRNFPNFYFLTDDEIREKYRQISDENEKLNITLMSYKSVLHKHNLLQGLLPEIEQEQKDFWKLPGEPKN